MAANAHRARDTVDVMRRGALILVVILLLMLLLVVPVGIGAPMGGMPCPDCALSGSFVSACLALLLGVASIISMAETRRRVVPILPTHASEGSSGIPERPPR
jgi:hypothetical protein